MTQDPTQEPPFAGWRDELGVFALAVQFLTRLPVPRILPFPRGGFSGRRGITRPWG